MTHPFPNENISPSQKFLANLNKKALTNDGTKSLICTVQNKETIKGHLFNFFFGQNKGEANKFWRIPFLTKYSKLYIIFGSYTYQFE